MSAINWADFTVGCIIGAGVVGASVWRTLAVGDADVMGGLYSGIINSIAYYASVHFIVANNLTAYMGTAVGSTLIIMYMAYRKRLKKASGVGYEWREGTIIEHKEPTKEELYKLIDHIKAAGAAKGEQIGRVKKSKKSGRRLQQKGARVRRESKAR